MPTQYPEGFRPVAVGTIPLQKEGDTLQGKYKGKGKPQKVRGKTVETYLVETPDGVVTVLGSHQISTFLDAQKIGAEVWS